MRSPATAISCAVLLSAAACAAPAAEAPGARDAWVGSGDAVAAPDARHAPAIAPVPLEACGKTQDGFEGWLPSFKKHALEQHVSARTATALDGLTYDAAVIELDRTQKAFKRTFEEFSAERITKRRIAQGKELLVANAPLLAKVEERFGVKRELLVAIWGLETDFGVNMGRRSSLRSLATLAYDCRRASRFRGELLSALRIADRGDIAPADMLGAWAGELGQTQFLPSSYEKFAIDFDGDGRADLLGSTADALASTANYLAGHGWRPNEDYKPGTPNFTVLGEWNSAEIYRKTIALFASKLIEKR